MDKIYVGNGKERKFDSGSIIGITVDVDSILREFENHGFTTEQGKRKIRLDVASRRSVDQYGNSHAVTVNTWKPDNQESAPQKQAPTATPPAPSVDFEDEIPF